MDNSNQNLDLDSFEVKCINDYVHFILSFYFSALDENGYEEIRDFLLNYFMEGNFDEFLNVTNQENLQSKLKKINKMEELLRSRKSPRQRKNSMSTLEMGPKNGVASLQFKNHQLNFDANSGFENTSFAATRKKKGKNMGLQLFHFNGNSAAENRENNIFSSSQTTSFQGSSGNFNGNLFVNFEELNFDSTSKFPKFNELSKFKPLKTSGQQSNMMVSNNGTRFFKKPKRNNKKQFENECRIYRYLGTIEPPKFLKNCTCFVECFSDGILLSNGGLSLQYILKNREPLQRGNFDQLFDKVLELHCCAVTHNDLHCGNVVGFDMDDVRFIDFGLAKISKDKIRIEFLKRINRIFRGLFFSLSARFNLFQ